jgi:hypothetical protein
VGILEWFGVDVRNDRPRKADLRIGIQGARCMFGNASTLHAAAP